METKLHKVRFLTKNVEENHPDYRLITDRSAEFINFQQAMIFVRNIKTRLPIREVLIGLPEVEMIA